MAWRRASSSSRRRAYLASSPKNASNPAIQVSLSMPSSLTLARMFTSATTVTTNAYSVVEIAGSSQRVCVLALSTLMVNSSVSTNGCSVAANSITVNSGGTLNVGASPATINTAGTQVQSGGSTIGTVNTGVTVPQDPYASYQSQASAGFTSCQNYNNQTSLSGGGCWSNVNLGSNLTLNTGTYFFSGINMNSGSSVTGSGAVTIVTQSSFSPNGNITMTAPTSGAWAGMAIYAMGRNEHELRGHL